MRSSHAEQPDVQNAVQDILAIRRSISSFYEGREGRIAESSFRANFGMQVVALVTAALFVTVEIFDHHLITTTMIEKNSQACWRALGIGCIGGFLALCVAIMYFIVRRSARTVGEELATYTKRNFFYLNN